MNLKDNWAEAHIKIARMTLTAKLDGNWNSFQLANNTPPLGVTGSVIAPSARMPSEESKALFPRTCLKQLLPMCAPNWEHAHGRAMKQCDAKWQLPVSSSKGKARYIQNAHAGIRYLCLAIGLTAEVQTSAWRGCFELFRSIST